MVCPYGVHKVEPSGSAEVEGGLPLPSLPATSGRKTSRQPRRRMVRRGARIFEASAPFARAYRVVSGEVMIIRDGLPVDLVEAGELLDARYWGNATAIAHTDCALASPRAGV